MVANKISQPPRLYRNVIAVNGTSIHRCVDEWDKEKRKERETSRMHKESNIEGCRGSECVREIKGECDSDSDKTETEAYVKWQQDI